MTEQIAPQYNRGGPMLMGIQTIVQLYNKTWDSVSLGNPIPRQVIPTFYPETNEDYRIGILITNKLRSEIGGLLHAAATITGSGFANQPANDSVTATTDSDDDIGKIVRAYGTTNGVDIACIGEHVMVAKDTPEDIELANGDAKTDWGQMMGFELLDPDTREQVEAVGTFTFKEKSGGLTITTIAAEASHKGITDIPDLSQDMGGLPFQAVASGASTAQVGILGEDSSKNDDIGALTLNGATAVLGQKGLVRGTKLLTGALAADRTVIISLGRLSYGAAPWHLTLGGENDPGYKRELPAATRTLFYVVVNASLVETAGGIADRLILEPGR